MKEREGWQAVVYWDAVSVKLMKWLGGWPHRLFVSAYPLGQVLPLCLYNTPTNTMLCLFIWLRPYTSMVISRANFIYSASPYPSHFIPNNVYTKVSPNIQTVCSLVCFLAYRILQGRTGLSLVVSTSQQNHCSLLHYPTQHYVPIYYFPFGLSYNFYLMFYALYLTDIYYYH